MPVTIDKKRPAAPPKTRGATWVYSRNDSRRLVEDGIPCPLIVRVGTDSWCYLVERAGLAWRLTHVRQDDSGCESYEVDLRRGSCTCPHAEHRGHCKKHVPALAAALNAIGVNP